LAAFHALMPVNALRGVKSKATPYGSISVYIEYI